MLRQLFLIALGDVIRNTLRYLAALLLARHYTGSIPLTMLAVNLVECFFIGLLISLCSDASRLRLLFITGFCDGFTTFSTFTTENYSMFRKGTYGLALLCIANSVLIGLLALWLGLSLSRFLVN